MSSVANSVTKVFNSVKKNAKGLMIPALIGGAALLTGGLSLGASAAAGGGLLAQMFTKSVTQAGIGALMGGGVAAATGQDWKKGAIYGGLGGAITGAATGAVQHGLQGMQQSTVAPTGYLPTGETPAAAAAINQNMAAATANANTSGSLPQSTRFGSALAGLGQGLGAGIGAYMQHRSDKELLEDRQQFELDKEQRIRDSYNISLGNPYTSSEKRKRQKARRSGFRFDPQSGTIVFDDGEDL